MRTLIMLTLAIIFFAAGNMYCQEKTILHAKVICSDNSAYEPKDADKPEKFQEYDPVDPILTYESGNQYCHVLVGYDPENEANAQEAAVKISDNADKI